MTFADLFKGKVVVDQTTKQAARPRFSLTSDIVSFRRCARQYGYFEHEGFVPSRVSQAFYGNVIHQVLDRCHRYYRGLEDPETRGECPPQDKVEEYFEEVASALIAHGVRPHRLELKNSAVKLLQLFNELEGPVLYHRVKETEYRLEEDRQDFILRGVVDVLATGPENDPGSYEIWDYKGSKKPELTSPLLQDYIAQMCVYAELYRNKTGRLPRRAILYFLNELEVLLVPGTTRKRPKRAVFTVEFTESSIAAALSAFEATAKDIIACKAARAWDPPKNPTPILSTCDECDLRWSCPAHPKGKYPIRMPI
jgi:putative RecB family exonuclease